MNFKGISKMKSAGDLLRFFFFALMLSGWNLHLHPGACGFSPRPTLSRPHTTNVILSFTSNKAPCLHSSRHTHRYANILREKPPKSYRLRRILLILAGSLISLAQTNPVHAAVTSISSETIGVRNAAIMISTFGGLALWKMGLPLMAKTLMISASRCAVQVFLLGSVVLHRLMGASNPILVGAWILGVGMVAGREAFSRVQYIYPNMRRHVYTSLITGTFAVLAMALLSVFQLDPWYQPRTLIPVAGMLFGNTLSAAALGASEITKQFAVHRNSVEIRLARGASATEATLPLVRQALLTALTPTINGLAVTGIVHIPGMMTGQILAGQSPEQAAAYQIIINFLIATTACITVQLLVKGATSSIVDFRQHRLRENLVPKVNNEIRKTFRELFSDFVALGKKRERTQSLNTIAEDADSLVLSNELKFKALSTDTVEGDPILEVKNMYVARPKVKNLTFSLGKGERIGITGESGIGKSQILRTLVGFENYGTKNPISIGGAVVGKDVSWPEFRTRVCLVPQERTNLEGTPLNFFEEMSKFALVGESSFEQKKLPWDISKDWKLPEGVWNRPWASLSGGEAQRVSLAIALSTNPEVLLLDESLNALDGQICKIVERSLKDSGIPIVMVTHSKDQLERFCTREFAMRALA